MKHHGIKAKKFPDGINSKLKTMRVGVRTTTKNKELEFKESTKLKRREVNKAKCTVKK